MQKHAHCVAGLLMALLVFAVMLALAYGPLEAAQAEESSPAIEEVAAETADTVQVETDEDAVSTDQEAVSLEERTETEGETTEETTAAPVVKKNITVSVRFVGTDGVWYEQKSLTLVEGASAWDATRSALTSSGLSYRTGTESTQDVLVSVTRNQDGATASLDSTTGSGWHLYLNGERYLGSSSSRTLANGDTMEWRYEVGTFMVSVAVVGPGGSAASYWIAPTSVRMRADQTVWDATLEVFAQNQYDEGRLFSYTTTDNGSVALESLSGLGENGITGESWQLFVNGVMPEEDAAHCALHAGDSICWYYAGKGEFDLPSFVAQSGGASQNPATAVSIEGAVAQARTYTTTSQTGLYEALDRVSGLGVTGSEKRPMLVREGTSTIDPLTQTLDDTGWRGSLAHALDVKLSTGEGATSVMGLDKSLYYVGTNNDIVKLELR